MISASGSDPLELPRRRRLHINLARRSQLMNDPPGPEALADPTLIMLREAPGGGLRNDDSGDSGPSATDSGTDGEGSWTSSMCPPGRLGLKEIQDSMNLR